MRLVSCLLPNFILAQQIPNYCCCLNCHSALSSKIPKGKASLTHVYILSSQSSLVPRTRCREEAGRVGEVMCPRRFLGDRRGSCATHRKHAINSAFNCCCVTPPPRSPSYPPGKPALFGKESAHVMSQLLHEKILLEGFKCYCCVL